MSKVRMIARLKIEAQDFLHYNPAVRNAVAQYKMFRAERMKLADTATAIDKVRLLCAAARLASTERMVLEAESAIQAAVAMIHPAEIPWKSLLPDPGSNRLTKGIILKPYVSEREKGVVFVSFENQMARLTNSTNLKRFAERYTLVVAPSWSRPHSVYTYLFPLVYPDTIVSLISNSKDMTYFPRIHPKYDLVSLYASNWVDPRKFKSVSTAEKNIDIYMLANFAKFKRHHALFRALQNVPRHYRVVLNGQNEPGRTRASILHEAAAFGVRDRFELRDDITQTELVDNLAHAKTSVVLSLREGSCVGAVEAMFSNTPVGMMEDAEIGSRAFITPETGRLLKHAHLGEQLTDFVETSHTYEPQRWVTEHGVGCVDSSTCLNDALRTRALANGNEWTIDIVPLQWRPEPQYYNPDDAARMTAAHDDMAACGLQIGQALA